MKSKILVVILCLYVLTTAHQAFALGFSVSPSSLVFDLGKTTSQEQILSITNGSKDPAHFELYADDFESSFTLTPHTFDLESGASQQVKVTARAAFPAMIATKISILARTNRTTTSSFQTGMKISVSVTGASPSHLQALIGSFSSKNIAYVLLAFFLLYLMIMVTKVYYVHRKKLD